MRNVRGHTPRLQKLKSGVSKVHSTVCAPESIMAEIADVVAAAVTNLKEKLPDVSEDQIRKLVMKNMKKAPERDEILVEDLKAAFKKYAKPLSAKRWKEYAMHAWLELNPDGKVRHKRVYDTFKSQKMKEIKLAKPGISFGDLMREVGEAWKKEKAAATTTASTCDGDESTPLPVQVESQTHKKRAQPGPTTSPPRRRITRVSKQ